MNMQALKQAANNKFQEVEQATMEGVANATAQAKNLQGQVNTGVSNLNQGAQNMVQGARAGVGNAIEAQKAQHAEDMNHPGGKVMAGYDHAKAGVKKFFTETIPDAQKKINNEYNVAKGAANGAFVKTQSEYEKTEESTETNVEGQQLPQGGRRRRRKRRKSKRWPHKKSKSKSKKSRKRRKKKGGRKSRKKKRRRSRKKSRRRRRR